MNKIRWGIVGCGGIANKFATSAAPVEIAGIEAAASRTVGKAADFAAKHGIPRHYSDYISLAQDPGIDAVYIATTHNFHFENVKFMLEHGKPVLCEKPFTVNYREMKELAELAASKNLFIMEGMWTRFLPAVIQLRKWLAEGAIGKVRQVRATFGFNMPFDPESRLYNPELAGGATLDAGIYPLSFANMVFRDKPEQIKALCEIGRTGVDEQSVYIMQYPGGGLSVLTSAISCRVVNSAEVIGEEGKIVIPDQFLSAREVWLDKPGDEVQIMRFEFPDQHGFKYEIEAASQSILDGQLENSVMPVGDTLQLMETIDSIKEQLGLRYGNDQ